MVVISSTILINKHNNCKLQLKIVKHIYVKFIEKHEKYSFFSNSSKAINDLELQPGPQLYINRA